MNEQLIQEAVARMAGIEGDFKVVRGFTLFPATDHLCYNDPVYGWKKLPAYHTSDDAAQRVIEGLDDDETIKYIHELYRVVTGGGWINGVLIDIRAFLPSMLKSTPLQKCEAILKAKGLWTKEIEG